MIAPSASKAWLCQLRKIINDGHNSAPREKPTLELSGSHIQVDMRKPVLRVDQRKLSYQFMAAEAYWILTGDDTVDGIAPWNRKIADFSDDGEKFFGAYGPKIVGQLPYVINKLSEDHDTRQAGLVIWRENPGPTKDVPCTVSIWCVLHGNTLDLHVFMRSSDAWLGLPYDIFNFSMLAHYIAGNLAQSIIPGTLHLTMVSSHLYRENYDAALVLMDDIAPSIPDTPDLLYQSPEALLETLKLLRETKPGHPLRWWEGEPK